MIEMYDDETPQTTVIPAPPGAWAPCVWLDGTTVRLERLPVFALEVEHGADGIVYGKYMHPANGAGRTENWLAEGWSAWAQAQLLRDFCLETDNKVPSAFFAALEADLDATLKAAESDAGWIA
jgi:hypothetical protein